MFPDKLGGITFRFNNNERLKYQYRARKIGFAVVCFVSIWNNLLVMATPSSPSLAVPDTSLALEFHPKELTCTLYIRKTTSGDANLWNKLIYDNKKSVLCFFTTQNQTVPDPDISFLEQCTINLIVVTDFPYDYVFNNVHSVRSSYHSAFIILSTDGCTHFPFLKTHDLRPLIFYYFPFCKKFLTRYFRMHTLTTLIQKAVRQR